MRATAYGLVLSVCAVAGAFAQTTPVTFIPAATVAGAFAKGEPLVETGTYKIHASRRTAPGVGEVHDLDTDVIYVLEGSAAVVIGGRLVDPRTIAPGEQRGASIAGGETRRLAKGDVLVVPNGVPHWFEEVQGPLLYYVVKVTATSGGPR